MTPVMNATKKNENKTMQTKSKQSKVKTLHDLIGLGDTGTGQESAQSEQPHANDLKYGMLIFPEHSCSDVFTGVMRPN